MSAPHLPEVSWRPPPTDPTLIIKSDEVATLDVEHSTSAFVLLVDQSTAEWVELTWTDHLGVSRSKRVDLDGP
jgi:hypothetical protein